MKYGVLYLLTVGNTTNGGFVIRGKPSRHGPNYRQSTRSGALKFRCCSFDDIAMTEIVAANLFSTKLRDEPRGAVGGAL